MKTRVFAAIVLCLACAGCHVQRVLSSGSNGNPGVNSTTSEKRTVNTSAKVERATQLRVNETFGSIATKTREGATVEVSADLRASGPQPKSVLQSWADKAGIEVVRDGSALVVQLKKPAGLPKDISVYASYRIDLPGALEQQLHSDNGAITVTGPTRAVDASSSFGEIRVDNVDGPVKANSSNGAVTVQNARGDVDAHSTFGEIRLKSIRGRVVAKTDNGAISTEDIEGNVDAVTSFGEIRATNVRGALTGSSNNGAVNARDVHAEGKDVALTSSFGQVDFAGDAGRLTMRSDNGTVSANLPSIPRQTTMTSSFGEIKLSIPRNSSVEVDSETDFGSVSVEGFPGAPSSGDRKRWVGKIGAGGSSIKLKTNNGSITLKAR